MTHVSSPISAVSQSLASLEELRMLFDPPAAGPVEGEFVPLAQSSLVAPISHGIGSEFPSGLFYHQHRAIENVLAGQHTITATRTSSGKSLTFALPALHALVNNPDATSLFLYPQKALANDQLAKLESLVDRVPNLNLDDARRRHLVGRYDGGVHQDDRKSIRDNVQLLLTNPDMLHLGILQHHGTLWERFFSNLQYVAIDECHEYRGVFGTGVAFVLRRLRQICRIHGGDPTFIASSATIADPQAHMNRLTGLEFALVGPDEDRSRQGRRKFWMVSGGGHHYETGRRLAMHLAEQGLSVLAFCPSRVAAERMLARMRRSDGSFDEHVAVYRSGLSAGERESIERGLRDGSKRLVFSTSALELGIDIGQLDVVICIGLPSSMMSLWQRAGRVARAGREGAIVLVPGDSPIDTYYARHPNELFARSNEPIAVNTDNQRLVIHHYACAIQEQGGDEKEVDASLLGETAMLVRRMREEGKLDPEEFYRKDPHGEVNLRTTGEANYQLMDGQEPIGEIGDFHLIREAPRNAIYRHAGRTYRVKDVLRGKQLVVLQRETTRNETKPYVRKDIRLKRFIETCDYPLVKLATGRLDVTEHLGGLTERSPNGQVARTWPGSGGMAPNRLPTEGTLIVFKPDLTTKLQGDLGERFRPAMESAHRLMCGLFPTVAGPCDPQDYSSGCAELGTGELAVVLYDLAYDGVGLVRDAYDNMAELIDKTIDRIESCECDDDAGCFRCVANPLEEAKSSKSGAFQLLSRLRQAVSSAAPNVRRFDYASSMLEESNGAKICNECQTTAPDHARFCMNCAAKLEN